MKYHCHNSVVSSSELQGKLNMTYLATASSRTGLAGAQELSSCSSVSFLQTTYFLYQHSDELDYRMLKN